MQGNKDLSGITHIIVDEVHERSLLVRFFFLSFFLADKSVSSDELLILIYIIIVNKEVFPGAFFSQIVIIYFDNYSNVRIWRSVWANTKLFFFCTTGWFSAYCLEESCWKAICSWHSKIKSRSHVCMDLYSYLTLNILLVLYLSVFFHCFYYYYYYFNVHRKLICG